MSVLNSVQMMVREAHPVPIDRSIHAIDKSPGQRPVSAYPMIPISGISNFFCRHGGDMTILYQECPDFILPADVLAT